MTASNAAISPLVSIIMPCYKMGAFIGEALSSVAAQNYKNWELIVVDDCAPEDGTEGLVNNFASQHADHRVVWLRHETNLGVSAARRSAFVQCRGSYVAFLDADDQFLPEKLSLQVRVLEADSEVCLVHTGILVTGNNPEEANAMQDWFGAGGYSASYTPDLVAGILVENRICNSSVLCRADLIDVADFPETMVFQFEDKFLWSRMAARGKFHYLKQNLVKYRIHAESFTTRILQRQGAHELANLELGFKFRKAEDSLRSRIVNLRFVVAQLRVLSGCSNVQGRKGKVQALKFAVELSIAALGDAASTFGHLIRTVFKVSR